MNKKFQESSNIFFCEKPDLLEEERNLIFALHPPLECWYKAYKYLVIERTGLPSILLFSDDNMTNRVKEETQEVRPELPLCTPDLAGTALTSLITAQLPQLELMWKTGLEVPHPLPSVVWDILSLHYSPVPPSLEKSDICVAKDTLDGFNYFFSNLY